MKNYIFNYLKILKINFQYESFFMKNRMTHLFIIFYINIMQKKLYNIN